MKLSLLTLVRRELHIATSQGIRGAELPVHGGDSTALQQRIIVLRAGQRWSRREGAEDATLVILKGSVLLRATGQAWQGATGDLLDLPAEEAEVEALEEAALLLSTAAPRTTVPVQRCEGG